MACYVLDTDLAGLLHIAGERGIRILRDLRMTVSAEGLPDSVVERLQAIADKKPEDNA